MNRSFPPPVREPPTTRPLAAVARAWQEAMLIRLPPAVAHLVRLQQVPDLGTWKTTRKSASFELDRLASRRADPIGDGAIRDGLFAQERARLERVLRDLDAEEPAVRERAAIAAERPDGCACLGAGGLGLLTCVLSGGQAVFEAYCGCREGRRAREAATWAQADVLAAEAAERAEAERRAGEERTRDLLTRAGIDRRYAGCTFASFRALLARRGLLTEATDLLLRAREDSYASGDPLRGDYLYGQPGRGKTSVAVSILRAWVERGRAGTFVRCGDLTDALRAGWARRDGSGDELLERLRAVPLLVLDDFAMTVGSPVDRAVFVKLLAARHAGGLLTIFTSNYSIGEAAQRLAPEDGLYEAERLEGRLLEMCDPWQLETGQLRTGEREDGSA